MYWVLLCFLPRSLYFRKQGVSEEWSCSWLGSLFVGFEGFRFEEFVRPNSSGVFDQWALELSSSAGICCVEESKSFEGCASMER